MIVFDPSDCYWQADDGRIMSSAAKALVGDGDAALTAWKDAGDIVRRWPEDGSGRQTDASLQAVLSPYGVYLVHVTVTKKIDLWRRCSNDEAAKIQAALAAAAPREKGLFEAATEFRSDDEEYGALLTAAEGLFGADRAAELLAPSV